MNARWIGDPLTAADTANHATTMTGDLGPAWRKITLNRMIAFLWQSFPTCPGDTQAGAVFFFLKEFSIFPSIWHIPFSHSCKRADV